MRHGTLCAHDRYGGTDNRLVVCLVEDRSGDGAGLCRHGQNPDEQTQEDTFNSSHIHSFRCFYLVNPSAVWIRRIMSS